MSSMVFSILLLLALFLIGILIILILFLKKDELGDSQISSKVSILIAARDEEDNILDCLKSIDKLTYSNFEVWIGNDKSTDKTHELVVEYIQGKENFHLLNIESDLGSAKGKANVLAQLAHKAKGEYFFITDADIEVHPNWIQKMLASFDEKIGIVSGFTIAKDSGLFSRMQRIDWAYAMGMVKVVSDFGKPIVGIGNNMAVTKEAYFSTGGYENLPFSIVEDYQLFIEITNNGFGFRNLLHPEVTSFSKPIHNFLDLLHQRKRWMHGAFKLPITILIILFLQAAYYSLAVILFFLKPQIAINMMVLKMFIQSIFIKSIMNKVGYKVSFLNLIIFEIYQLILSTSSLIFYFIPVKIKWKGRSY